MKSPYKVYKYPEITVYHYIMEGLETSEFVNRGPTFNTASFLISGSRLDCINEFGNHFDGTWNGEEPEVFYTRDYPQGTYTMQAGETGMEYLCLVRTSDHPMQLSHVEVEGDYTIPPNHSFFVAKGSVSTEERSYDFSQYMLKSETETIINGTANIILIKGGNE